MKNETRMLTATALLALGLGSAAAATAVSGPLIKTVAQDSAQAVKDAYLEGRIASGLALNPHVEMFDVDVEVKNGVAFLSGTVSSKVERDIAQEIARGVDGVAEVRNSIQVEGGARKDAQSPPERSLGRTVDDASISASVKAKLLANENTSGLGIGVTTRNGVVSLSGAVKSEAEKDLAEKIAENTSGVIEVRNELVAGGRK